MHDHHPARRARTQVPAVSLTLAALALLAAVLLAPAAGAAEAVQQSILTLRTAGAADDVWLVAPDGTASNAGRLPGLAGGSASSSDGSMVAYVPERGAALWVWRGSQDVKTISLRAAGITGVTWIGPGKVLVSGSRGKGPYDVYSARLYTVNVASGEVKALRGVQGTQPSADVASGKVVYVRFRKLDNGSAANDYTPLIRESLMRLDMDTTAAPEVLASRTYRDYYETGFFVAPGIAPGGDWCISGRVPDDPEVTYTVWNASLPWFSLFQTGQCAAAWAPTGLKVAFCGSVDSSIEGIPDSCLFVLEPLAGSLVRSAVIVPAVEEANVWLDGVAWSADGRLAVDSITAGADTVVEEVHLLASDLATVEDLGPGRLSVWVD